MRPIEIKRLKENLGDARKKKAQLEDKHDSTLKKMQKIVNRDPFTDEDQAEFENLQKTTNGTKSDIQNQNKKVEDLTDQVLAIGEDPTFGANDENAPGMNGFNDRTPAQSGNVEEWENVSGENKGQKIKVMGPRASFGNVHGSGSKRDLEEYVQARVRGYTADNSFSNSMDTTSDSALVPQPLSDNIIDLARNKSRVIQAGAQTVEMPSKTLTIAKMKQDPAAHWKEEGAPMQEEDGTFGPLEFTAHTLVCSTRSTVELAEDAPGFGNQIVNSLSAQIGLGLDKAALMGSGTGAEPTGITNTSGVQMQTLGTGDGAALTGYADFSRAYQSILAANGTPNAVIYSPRTWGDLDRLTASDGQPLMAPQSYKNLDKYQTEQIPSDLTLGTSDDTSLAIVGDFSKCLIGIRTKMRLEVSRVGTVNDQSAWENLEISFRAYARYDVQLAHPNHFYVINGITPAE